MAQVLDEKWATPIHRDLTQGAKPAKSRCFVYPSPRCVP